MTGPDVVDHVDEQPNEIAEPLAPIGERELAINPGQPWHKRFQHDASRWFTL